MAHSFFRLQTNGFHAGSPLKYGETLDNEDSEDDTYGIVQWDGADGAQKAFYPQDSNLHNILDESENRRFESEDREPGTTILGDGDEDDAEYEQYDEGSSIYRDSEARGTQDTETPGGTFEIDGEDSTIPRFEDVVAPVRHDSEPTYDDASQFPDLGTYTSSPFPLPIPLKLSSHTI